MDNIFSKKDEKLNPRYLFTSCGNIVKQFNIKTGKKVFYYQGFHSDYNYIYISAMTLTSDGKYFFTASWDKSVKQFDIETHQEVYHYKGIYKHTNHQIALKPY